MRDCLIATIVIIEEWWPKLEKWIFTVRTLLVGAKSEERQSSSAVDKTYLKMERIRTDTHLRSFPDEDCQRSTYSSTLAFLNDGISAREYRIGIKMG